MSFVQASRVEKLNIPHCNDKLPPVLIIVVGQLIVVICSA